VHPITTAFASTATRGRLLDWFIMVILKSILPGKPPDTVQIKSLSWNGLGPEYQY
jgi:hypothetical protein